MVRQIDRLSPAAVKNAKPGMLPDGGGLYLQATSAGDGIRRSWLFRFVLKGRERWMGLGSLQSVTLAEARAAAAGARKLTGQGIDPIEARNESRAAAAAANAKQMTFADAAAGYISAHRSGWGNVKHAAQWSSTLEAYAFPVFGKVGIQDVDTALVLKVLEPIWNAKTETAYRIRGRIENILDWARARGLRNGENPARWKGHLDHLLPARSKVRRAEHHAALPYDELPAFLKELRKQPGVGARAIEFTILTAARTGEVIGATAAEISGGIWTVPPERMKSGREHRVPLCGRALAILAELEPLRGAGEFLFPGVRGGLSAGLMLNQLWRMGRGTHQLSQRGCRDGARARGFKSGRRGLQAR